MGCGSSVLSEFHEESEESPWIKRRVSQHHHVNRFPRIASFTPPEKQDHAYFKFSSNRTTRPVRKNNRRNLLNKRSEPFDLVDLEETEGLTEIPEDERVPDILESLNHHLGEWFVDPAFPPTDRSIYYKRKPVEGKITWMRPHEMTPEPQLLVDGVSRNDIVQGILGDCWFLSSCAAVAQFPELMRRVIPPSQPLYGRSYKGVLRFRFWRFGRWITVYVDDLLPTKDGEMIFSRCTLRKEFWVALLEKAYAKLHGSYEALEGGQAMDALVDLTGGLAERYDLDESPPNLYDFLLKASRNGAFITCSRKGDWRQATTADPNGLVSGHAYTVTAVAKIPLRTGEKAELLRVRNPWGNAIEWKGKWNDCDPVWYEVDPFTRTQLDWKRLADGEFWMQYEDFKIEFEEVSICTLGPDFDGDGVVDHPGQVKAIHGCWEEGKSCGGSRNNLASFAKNPQFLLTLHTPRNQTNRDQVYVCNLVIALMQAPGRRSRQQGSNMYQIAFMIYKAEDPENRLTLEYFMNNFDVANSGAYINYREVFGRFELTAGRYVIIPATYEPNCAGAFMIRVYADCTFEIRELL